jgi:hypothetical protein
VGIKKENAPYYGEEQSHEKKKTFNQSSIAAPQHIKSWISRSELDEVSNALGAFCRI